MKEHDVPNQKCPSHRSDMSTIDSKWNILKKGKEKLPNALPQQKEDVVLCMSMIHKFFPRFIKNK